MSLFTSNGYLSDGYMPAMMGIESAMLACKVCTVTTGLPAPPLYGFLSELCYICIHFKHINFYDLAIYIKLELCILI